MRSGMFGGSLAVKFWGQRLLGLIVACLGALACVPAGAQPNDAPDPSLTSPPPIDANALPVAISGDQRLRGYVDGLMRGLMTSGEFPGAVILVIKNGEVAFKSGYGFADIENRTPVEPDKTLFRVASISKLFTATAVMQLVEAGKLDLNADVNTYLSTFKIPAVYPEAITLSHVLTHTPGLDDVNVGIGAPLDAKPEPLRDYLAKHFPRRIMTPGKMFSYSNHGYALAGLIVEEASGEDYNAYIQSKIFAPLGMKHSTFGIPDPVPPEMAQPYSKGGNGYRKIEMDRMTAGPAGDVVTSATDLARFMISHLKRGAKILAPETADFMQAQHFEQVRGLDGWAYGFAEGERNGVRWIGHGGSWPGYCADLVLVPETQSGYFFAYNTDCHFGATQAIRLSMFNGMWPVKNRPPSNISVAGPEAAAQAEAIAGTYMSVRRSRADFTVLGAASEQTTVEAIGDGKLEISLPSVGHPVLFLPRADGLWESPDYQWRAAALTDGDGEVTHLVINASVFDRVGWVDNWAFWMALIAIVFLVNLLSLWGWTNGFVSRRLYGEPQAMIGLLPRLAGYLAVAIATVATITFAVLLGSQPVFMILHGPDPFIQTLLALPVALAVLSLPMIVFTVMGFGDDGRARLAQIGYGLTTLSIIIFVVFAWHWNLQPFAHS